MGGRDICVPCPKMGNNIQQPTYLNNYIGPEYISFLTTRMDTTYNFEENILFISQHRTRNMKFRINYVGISE